MIRTARTLLAGLLLMSAASDRMAAGVSPQRNLQGTTQAAAPVTADTVRIGVLRNGTSYEVVSLPIEVYVARVLAGEAAPESPPAALEALAVAIRTYTVTNRARHAADGFDLCDQTHCQVMRNATPATEHAARATADRILLYRGSPATVFYSASCGGRSEKPSNVWPGADNPPYLPIHDDDGCGGFPMWSAEIALADLQRALTAGGFRGTLRDIRIQSRNDSGRVGTLALDGMTPGAISGQDLRMVVGRSLGFQHIQSTQFELRHTGRAFRFTGRGAGHGVGMCVIGSMKLAAAGQTAATILARYFPGTQIGSYAAPRLTAAPPPRETAPPAAPLRDARAVTPAAAAAPRAVAPAPAAPPAARAEIPENRAPSPDVPAVVTDVVINAPTGDLAERNTLLAIADRERSGIASAMGVAPPPIRVQFHPDNEAFERATGRPWYALSALIGNEIELAPLWLLRERGMLERAMRRQIVHVIADPVLPARPAWIREGASAYFADPQAVSVARQPCPQDVELLRPLSQGALGEALARARACFERQVSTGRDWRRVR